MQSKVNNPKVSILIPVFNGKNYISRAIDSCLSQTYTNFEIVLVDNGSTDNTYDFIQDKYRIHLDNCKIKLFRKSHAGPNSARNYAFHKSIGKYICFLDSDDFCAENRLEKSLDFIEREKSDLIFARYLNIYTNDSDKLQNLENYETKVGNDPILLTTAFMKRDVFLTTDDMDEEIEYCEDFEWVCRASLLGFAVDSFMDEVVYYRIRRDNSFFSGALGSVEKHKQIAWTRAIRNKNKVLKGCPVN